MAVTSLIPARFLCLVSHLVMSILLLWSRDNNVKACLPETYTQDAYNAVDTGLLVGIILMIVFLLVEIVGFVSGVSMFIAPASLFSTVAHASASVSFSYFLFEQWPCYNFWWIFVFCSVLPMLLEVVVLVGVLVLKRVK